MKNQESAMGYDVTVKFSNEQERQLMKSFLEQHQSILEKLAQADGMVPYHDSMPALAEDLGYAPKIKYGLGFHGTGIPKYIWDTCAWMSIQSSWRSPTGGVFFYYDDEKMTVTTDKNNQKETVVYDNGLPYEKPDTGNAVLDNIKKMFKIGRNDAAYAKGFEELHEAWLRFQAQHKPETKKRKP